DRLLRRERAQVVVRRLVRDARGRARVLERDAGARADAREETRAGLARGDRARDLVRAGVAGREVARRAARIARGDEAAARKRAQVVEDRVERKARGAREVGRGAPRPRAQLLDEPAACVAIKRLRRVETR